MIREQQLIPYAATPTTAEAVLVLAPHPDDEVFGCGGALALHAEAGSRIHVVLLTKGDAGGDSAARLQESREAAQVLGYPPPLCWELPDRGLVYGEALVQRILDTIAETGATLVYAPSLWENHPDHRAVALAALEAVRRHGRGALVQFEISAPLRPNRLVDITAVLKRKQAAMACFPSQLARQRYDKQIESLNVFRTFTLPGEIEAAEAYEYYSAAELASPAQSFLQSEYHRQYAAGLINLPQDCPLVSILVRSMSRPQLDEALGSIAVQTWPNIEVVVVNAKGPGHRPLPAWCGRYPLRLVDSPENLRRSRAANVALENARGEFALFLDDDDSLDPDHIAKLAGYLQANSAIGMAYTGVRVVDESGRQIADFSVSAPAERMLLGNYIPIHGAMFRTSLIDRHGCKVDEGLDMYEDWDFWLQLMQHAEVRFVDGISASYKFSTSPDHPVHDLEKNRPVCKELIERWHPAWTPSAVLRMRAYVERLESDLKCRRAEGERMSREYAALQAEGDRIRRNLQAQIDEAQAEVRRTREKLDWELHRIYHSLSWRVTAPLRALRRLFL